MSFWLEKWCLKKHEPKISFSLDRKMILMNFLRGGKWSESLIKFLIEL